MLDPLAIEDDWFALEPVGLTVVPRGELTEDRRVLVLDSIRALGLNHPWLVRLRSEYFDEWSAGHTTSDYVRRHAPFVAREIERLQITPEGDERS